MLCSTSQCFAILGTPALRADMSESTSDDEQDGGDHDEDEEQDENDQGDDNYCEAPGTRLSITLEKFYPPHYWQLYCTTSLCTNE